MYTELLTLCGYEKDEIERERPRIDKAFKRLELGSEDIKRGEKRVREQFEVKLEGVRKLLGIWMKELIDMTLAKDEGKKVVYANWPPIRQPSLAVMYASENIYIQTPELVINITMGSIFDKLNPILEAAEENGFAPGMAHCSLVQAKIGPIIKGMIPVPDFLLTTSHLCDQAPSTDELVHELYGTPIAYLDRCFDHNWGDWPDSKDRSVEYLGARIKMALDKLEGVVGYKVTDEAWHTASIENVKLWLNYQTLIELVAKGDPQALSQADLGLILWFVLGTPTRRSKDLNTALISLTREAKRRIDSGKGVVEKGAPRVIYRNPSTVDPEFAHMIEGFGVAVPIAMLSWLPPMQRRKPKHRSYYDRFAEAVMNGGTVHGIEGNIARWKEACETYKVDGAIFNYAFSCRPMCYPAYMIKKALQDELNIPVLALEHDWWDKRDYGAEQLRTRVETFAELLKANKAAKAAKV